MSNVSVFGGANLPSVKSLSSALRSIESSASAAGMAILKMDKTGHWVFGADQTEVEDDSLWAINPFSFVHGYIAWGDGEVLGEKMVSVAEPLPELDPAPGGAKSEDTVKLEAFTVTGSNFKRLDQEKVLPVTIFMYRAQQGAPDPTLVFLPILLATSASTLVGPPSCAR